MQENNNFETTLETWRTISGEQPAESNFMSMSGDNDVQPVPQSKKKEDEATLLMSDKSKNPVNEATQTDKDGKHKESGEKHGLIVSDLDDKDSTGDKDDDIDDSDLENDNKTSKSSENKQSDSKWDKTVCGDKVDSVYLRQPPSHKSRSAAASSTPDEDCGIKCLYYTLQCCDCVLM